MWVTVEEKEEEVKTYKSHLQGENMQLETSWCKNQLPKPGKQVSGGGKKKPTGKLSESKHLHWDCETGLWNRPCMQKHMTTFHRVIKTYQGWIQWIKRKWAEPSSARKIIFAHIAHSTGVMTENINSFRSGNEVVPPKVQVFLCLWPKKTTNPLVVLLGV